MKRSHYPCVHALTARFAKAILCVIMLWMATVPQLAWSQSAVWLPPAATTGNIYYNGGNVGIGTTNPLAPFHVSTSSTAVPRGFIVEQTSADSNAGMILLRKSRAGGAAVNGDYIGNLFSEAYDGTSWTSGARIRFAVDSAVSAGSVPTSIQLFTGTGSSGGVERMRINSSGNVGIGTASPQYKLTVEGVIGARDVIVTNAPWSDYVFRSDYQLRPLTEVASFIEQYGHLPDIPSEAEVKEMGVSVAGIQAKLLAKIEELTLHMIQQEKDNRQLRQRLAQLETRTAFSSPPVPGR